jgi:hypothetical protein
MHTYVGGLRIQMDYLEHPKMRCSWREAEQIVNGAKRPYPRQIDNGKIMVRGQTRDGRWLQVIYVLETGNVVFVIHARPLTEMEKRQIRRNRR